MKELREKTERKRRSWWENNNIDTEKNLERVLGLVKRRIGDPEVVGYKVEPRGVVGTYLEIAYKDRKFKLELSETELCVTVLAQNKAQNKKNKERYHLIPMKDGKKSKFYGETCWEDAIAFLGKKIKNTYKKIY